MATVTFFDLLGVSEEPSPTAAAAALWPLGFIQATTGFTEHPDRDEVPLLVDKLQSALTFRAVRPGTGPDGIGVIAEVLVGTTAPPLVLSAFPDLEILPLPTSGGPARVYVHKRESGTEIVVDSLPVEIRLPRRLIMPLEDQPGQPVPDEKTVLEGFIAGLHDTIEVVLRRDQPTTIRVHIKVRMTEERNFVLETAVPISIGECRFNNFPCRAIHDLSFVPTPILSDPHDAGEQPLEWTRHTLESPGALGERAGGILAIRMIDLHDERPPFAELADKPNEDRDEEEHVEIVLEDLALPIISPGYPIPTHFLIGLRRKLELGDDPFGAYNLAGLPVRVRISGFGRILADWLIIEQLLVRSVPWSHIDDSTPESQFLFLKMILSDDPDAEGSSATVTVSDEWTVELGWRHDPGKNLFKLFGLQFTLLGLRAGASILRIADGRSVGDSLLAVGDLQMTFVGKSGKLIELQSATEKPWTRVIHDFGWRLGSPSLGKFWDPNGAKLTACDVLRFDVDEFGFTSEPSGGRYIAFSGTIPIGGSPDDKPATDAASTTTDDKAQDGVGFRFYRLRGKIGGPPEAPDTLIDGIGLSVRYDRLKLSGFGSLSERLEDDGHRYKEIGLGLQLRLGAAGAELIVGGNFFHGHVSGPQHNFTYWLAGVQVSPIPLGSGVELRNVRLMGAQNMAPNLGPADVGAAQPMRMFDWYKSHSDSLELSPSRNLTSNGWTQLDDAFAAGAGLALSLGGKNLVTLDVFALFGRTPSGSAFLAVVKVFAFKSQQPLGFGAFEVEVDRWSLMIGLSIGPENVIGKKIPLLESTPMLTGLIYATNKPSTIAIGHINDTSSWLALHVKGDLWVFKFEFFAGVCLEIVDSPEGPRVFGLRISVTGGSRFLGIGGIDFYLTLQFTAGVWRTESKVSGFIAFFEGGAHFDVFFVFDFGASFKVEWDYLGPDPAYRRIFTEVKIHTPWWLPDVTFRWNKVISNPALERMQVIGTPIVESSAHALAKKAADSVPVTPLLGTEIVQEELHRMSDVAALGDASFPPGALDDLTPVAVDSVIALNFKSAVDDRIVWGQNTPSGMGTQASGEVSTRSELVEFGIRRRAHTGPDAGVWTTLVEAAHSRLESLIGLTPDEIAARLVPIVSLLWDGDFQREDKLEPRRLLVNAEVPFLMAELNFEADEALVRNGDGWPCCTRRKKPRWHTLDFRDIPAGERAPATQEFTDSHSTLHWPGAPPPVVGPGLLFPTPEPVARVFASSRAPGVFARMSFDELASLVDIVLFWRAMHLNRKLVVTPFRGLQVLTERTFPLSSPNLTRILLNEPDGITHVLLRFEGRPVQPFAAAAVIDWLELSRLRYRSRAEVLNDMLDGYRCNETNDGAAAGGKRFAWMANHDYELSLRTRVSVKDERSGELAKELQQKLFFVTKGLPGLNAVARVGDEFEPYVESRYPTAELPLYRSEPVILAFNERFDIFAALERPPSATDPPERKQSHDVVLAIEKVGGSGTERRISQTAPDWIVTHRSLPLPPVKHPPYVVSGSVLDAIVREGIRRAPSLDPLSVRYDAILVSPGGCGLPEPPARRSRTLSHDAVDPDTPDATPRHWPAQTVLRASVRRKEAPFVERAPFEAGDEGALTRVGGAAWSATAGGLGPDPVAATRQLGVFGEANWEHLILRAEVDAQNVEAGVAVAVGGAPLGSRALLAVVDPAAGRLRLLARRGAVDTELASVELTVTGPVALEVTAYDDEVHARVGDVNVSTPRGDLRAGRLALVATGGARFPSLRVDGLELYRFELTTSRYADLAEHIGSFGGTAAVLETSGSETRTIAELLAADPGLLAGETVDKLERQARFDRWASALALPLRRRVERLELSGRLDSDGRTDLVLIESPEPLPLGEDVSLGAVRLADPLVVLTPVIAFTNGDRTAAIVVPMGFGGMPTTLQSGTYRLRFNLDRLRYRAGATDAASRFQQEATLDVVL
jgi:hypothetical protein